MSSEVLSILENSEGTAKKTKVEGIPYWSLNVPIFKNTKKGEIGIEFEIEGGKLPTEGYLEGIVSNSTKVHWKRKEDGSLRGGYEYVLSNPCSIEEVPYMVGGLFSKFRDNKVTRIDNSNRCSTHVHFNISGYKSNEITSIICLWYIFEEVIIDWLGEARKTNHFCLSSKEQEASISSWSNFLGKGDIINDKGSKYCALNLNTIFSIGSLEFRCGRAADEETFPITWIEFIRGFCHFAKDRYQNPRQISFDISERGSTEIFRDILSSCNFTDPEAKEILFRDIVVDDFEEKCYKGFWNTQELIMYFPWDDWMEEINKEFVPDPFSDSNKKKKTSTGRGIFNLNLQRPLINENIRIEP